MRTIPTMTCFTRCLEGKQDPPKIKMPRARARGRPAINLPISPPRLHALRRHEQSETRRRRPRRTWPREQLQRQRHSSKGKRQASTSRIRKQVAAVPPIKRVRTPQRASVAAPRSAGARKQIRNTKKRRSIEHRQRTSAEPYRHRPRIKQTLARTLRHLPPLQNLRAAHPPSARPLLTQNQKASRTLRLQRDPRAVAAAAFLKATF
mmetsp:Transcript_20889/g.52784  ORF Transcript_20889/g.52784 Transcript_20889/m.52784 type:complete len:206 (-) Transcript_20889:1101-1718(-)